MSDLPVIDGIDWDYGRLHFAGMDDLLWETTEEYYMMLSDSMEKIQNFYNVVTTSDGLNSYRIETHSVKSTSALIGALQLFGLAKTAEFAAKEQDYDTIRAITPILLREMKKMQERMAEHFVQKAGAKDLDKDLVLALCKTIRQGMADMDIDAVDEAIAKLVEFDFGQQLSGTVQRLKLATMNLDAGKTNELLDMIEWNL